MIVWRMIFVCYITKATNKHVDCAIHVAFPLQQWLYKRTSVLRYTYITRLVMLNVCVPMYACTSTLFVNTIADFVRGH